MLSKRAVNTLRKMADSPFYFSGRFGLNAFGDWPTENHKANLLEAKRHGKLRGCGKKTIKEILDYQAQVHQHCLALKKEGDEATIEVKIVEEN